MRLLVVAVLAALLCAGADAQNKIYKVRTPDGKIVFTDRPPPGATIVEERDAPPTPAPARAPAAPKPAPAPAAATASTGAAKGDTVGQPQPLDRSAQIDKAFADVQTAEREFDAARQQLEAGRAPREGDLLGTARGGNRVGPEYHKRIAELEKAVSAAEQKLTKARSELDAVR